MSETPAERSKRKFLDYFDQHEWQYQVTVFLKSPDDIENAIEIFAKARKHFARKNREHPILWRIGAKRVNPSELLWDYEGPLTLVNMPYMTLFTTKEFQLKEAVSQFDSLRSTDRIFAKQRSLTEQKLISTRSKISRERPHNLKAIFEKRKIERFGRLNS